MKQHFYSLLTLLAVVFSLSSCQDVPAPYEKPGSGGGGGGTVIEPKGTGTAADPFNVAAAIAKCKETGTTETAEAYYVEGVVKSLDISGVAQYGNINIDMIDEGGKNVFKAFQIYSFNGQKFTEAVAASIKVGDKVVVKGKLVNYSGNTPETVGKGAAYLVSLNGKGGGGDEPGVDPKGAGTEADPFNVAAAINKCKETGETATSDFYYVKGIVSNVDESGLAQYGNINLDLVDKTGSSSSFKAFQIYSFDAKKFTTAGTVKVGDEVVVKGKLVNYKGNTPETTGKGEAYLITVNGKGGGGGGDEPGTPSGTGTESDPFNVAAAIKKCQETGETATTDQFFVKGKVKTVDASGAAQYGNINVDIVDDGATAVFKAFQIYSFKGEKFTEATAAKLKVGDVIVVKGNLVNYKGNTPETTGKGAACLITVNGKTEFDGGVDPEPGPTPGGEVITAASFGLENAAVLSTLTLSDGTTISFDKSDGSTAPAYYTAAGGTFRIYPKNTITFNSTKKIASITFNCDEYQGTQYIAEGNVTCAPGTVTLNGLVFTFSAINSNSCVITNTETVTGGKSQMRIKSFIINYAE